jgi:hypothetical protein
VEQQIDSYMRKPLSSNPSIAQLTRAIGIRQKIETLTEELHAILGGAPAKAGRKKTSAAGPRRKMSAASRARIAAAARLRWKAAKAAGRTRL